MTQLEIASAPLCKPNLLPRKFKFKSRDRHEEREGEEGEEGEEEARNDAAARKGGVNYAGGGQAVT